MLARTQTDWVISQLNEKGKHPDLTVEVITIRTTGDAVTDRALSQIGGKGLFTKELEDALLAGTIDLAVHSLKDLPTDFPPGMALGAIPVREDPRDALIGKTVAELQNAAAGVKIGTSSLRRIAQLRRLFPQAEMVDLRGNVDTRLRKVREGQVDAAVMALAGLRRLGRDDEVKAVFEPDQMLPAPGQGALGIEIRLGDDRLTELLEPIRSERTERCVTAERALLARLGGGCLIPVGALAGIEDGTLELVGRVISVDGRQMIAGSRTGPAERADEIGTGLAEELIAQGAGEIIEAIERQIRQGQSDD